MRRTCTGCLFYIWQYTCFRGVLSNHPTLAFSHWVQKSVLYFCVSFAALHVGFSFSSLQSLSRVQHFATPWTAARQTSLSITNYRSLLKLMSIEIVMPSNHLILCSPLLLLPSIFPSIRVFFQWVSSSHQVAKVLEFQLQHQSFQRILRTDLLWDGLVGSPCNEGTFRVFSNTTVQKHQFFSAQLSL